MHNSGLVAGKLGYKLYHFKEVYTSKNWMVRLPTHTARDPAKLYF